MDLFLMDLILKGKIPEKCSVLDVGCGEGRNGIYFIQNGYEYHGWDLDVSKLQLLEYLSNTIEHSNAHFASNDLRAASTNEKFELIICSRVLHFAENEGDFMQMWKKLSELLSTGSLIYVSVDSTVDTDLGAIQDDGKVEFPDGKLRFVLTSGMYNDMKKGFEEVEPLKTLVHHGERAQSFLLLKKN